MKLYIRQNQKDFDILDQTDLFEKFIEMYGQEETMDLDELAYQLDCTMIRLPRNENYAVYFLFGSSIEKLQFHLIKSCENRETAEETLKRVSRIETYIRETTKICLGVIVKEKRCVHDVQILP